MPATVTDPIAGVSKMGPKWASANIDGDSAAVILLEEYRAFPRYTAAILIWQIQRWRCHPQSIRTKTSVTAQQRPEAFYSLRRAAATKLRVLPEMAHRFSFLYLESAHFVLSFCWNGDGRNR